MWRQCLIDMGGPYLVGAFLFSPILKIGPFPTPGTPGFNWTRGASRLARASQSLTLKAIRLPRDP
jgi:hypothetical protein